MWTKLCEHCDICRDMPCECCKREWERHDKRKKSECKFECKSIDFCRNRECELNESNTGNGDARKLNKI